MMTPSLSLPALRLARLPGELGPILRCSGELSVATAEILRRELACPLFYELGGEPEAVGCRSVLNPMIEAVRDGEKDRARAQIEELIRILEEMPLPPKQTGPAPWLPSALGDPAIG